MKRIRALAGNRRLGGSLVAVIAYALLFQSFTASIGWGMSAGAVLSAEFVFCSGAHNPQLPAPAGGEKIPPGMDRNARIVWRRSKAPPIQPRCLRRSYPSPILSGYLVTVFAFPSRMSSFRFGGARPASLALRLHALSDARKPAPFLGNRIHALAEKHHALSYETCLHVSRWIGPSCGGASPCRNH